jgi:type I restriction enzyme S subunit
MKSTWPTKKLGEIAEIYSGGRSGITKKDYVERGFPAFSAAGQDGFTKEAHDSGFAVILSSIGSRCGKCFYAEGEWTALANTQIIKFENPVTAKFMYYYLNDENKWPKTGTGQPFISPSVVKNLIVPLPPLPIQQKIVKILDTVQSAVEIQDKIIEKTKELKKSLMAELFKYGGPSFRKGRKLKETEIGEIPEDWEVVKIKDIVLDTEQNDPSKIPLQKIKYIDVSSISNEFFKIMEYKTYLGKDAPSRARKILKVNDVIFATVRPYLKRIALITEEYNGFYGSTAFCVLRPNIKKISPYFLFYYVTTDKFVYKVSGYQTGSSYPAITDDHIKKENIPLPPLPEQQEIAEILQTIDQKIEIERKKKELYEELFKTLLNKIMNQEIDVDSLDLSELEN